jgi:hypothetical protein
LAWPEAAGAHDKEQKMEDLIGAAIGIFTTALFLAVPAGLGMVAAIAVASHSARRARKSEVREWVNSPRAPAELTTSNRPA